ILSVTVNNGADVIVVVDVVVLYDSAKTEHVHIDALPIPALTMVVRIVILDHGSLCVHYPDSYIRAPRTKIAVVGGAMLNARLLSSPDPNPAVTAIRGSAI